MVNERIAKFNKIVGNAPAEQHEKEKFWQQAILQAKLIQEEANEMVEACLNRDLVEMVDAWCDVDYLQNHAENMLGTVGVLLYQAKDQVCLNNDSKYTTSLELATMSKDHQNKNGNPCYIEDVEYRGDTYFILKRMSDGKVMKLLGHQPPNIRSSIPDSVFEAINDYVKEED